MAKVISLQELQTRIEALEILTVRVENLEAEVKELKGIKPVEEKKAATKPAAKPAKGDTLVLLNRLEKAKKAGDKKEMFKVRKLLRKAGYSLRKENGKK